MSDNFTKIKFDTVFNVKSIVTLFYMELNKNFKYDGENAITFGKWCILTRAR